ncbi:MAG: hypothetical protein OXE17_15380 [Chloroflexi bacterium]|nr:hypothetical protein [Chloroflexota bacterium]
MAQEPARCDACGRDLDERPFDPYQIPVSVNPNPDEPKNFVERSLKEHNQALDRLSGQLDDLLDLVRERQEEEGQVAELLDLLRQYMRPRHGLCIDGKCAPCRVHEEAIKEHVLLYIDWKVPGTVEKLQQTRHRN